jgi:hypothetical protein
MNSCNGRVQGCSRIEVLDVSARRAQIAWAELSARGDGAAIRVEQIVK